MTIDNYADGLKRERTDPWNGYLDVDQVLPREKLRGVKGGRREIPHATPATTFPLAWPCSR